MLCALLCVMAAVALACAAAERIKIDAASRTFVDQTGRTRIFHGVNAVYKIAPWHPSLGKFDPSNSLNREDAKNLRSWGFNVVRLGIMWPGVEPGARGVYDQNYLQTMETIVTNLSKEGIHVILDLHQDLWHRKFCGEGVPDYVYESCKRSEPAGTPPFPLPAVNATYPTDENGDPTLEACLSKGFATYYLSAEVGEGFQCLYDNRDGMWDALAGYWVAVAKHFSGFDHVLGYELINEPFANVNDPKSLLPKYTESKYLQPLYQHLHQAIRAVDDEKIVFFEGLTIDYWQSGFTAGPGGAEYNDRQALAYHVYCPLDNSSAGKVAACDAVDDAFFALRSQDAQRLGVPMIMTEFGASEDTKPDLSVLAAVARHADSFGQSWMYWQFKYFQDLTTCTPQGESLYQDDGSVCEDKLRVLSRTYPQAVAGAVEAYSYDVATGSFELTFVPGAAGQPGSGSGGGGGVSEIFVNRELAYPHGLHAAVSSAGADAAAVAAAFQVACPSLEDRTHVLVQQLQAFSSSVTVSIRPCGVRDAGACSCRRL